MFHTIETDTSAADDAVTCIGSGYGTEGANSEYQAPVQRCYDCLVAKCREYFDSSGRHCLERDKWHLGKGDKGLNLHWLLRKYRCAFGIDPVWWAWFWNNDKSCWETDHGRGFPFDRGSRYACSCAAPLSEGAVRSTARVLDSTAETQKLADAVGAQLPSDETSTPTFAADETEKESCPAQLVEPERADLITQLLAIEQCLESAGVATAPCESVRDRETATAHVEAIFTRLEALELAGERRPVGEAETNTETLEFLESTKEIFRNLIAELPPPAPITPPTEVPPSPIPLSSPVSSLFPPSTPAQPIILPN